MKTDDGKTIPLLIKPFIIEPGFEEKKTHNLITTETFETVNEAQITNSFAENSLLPQEVILDRLSNSFTNDPNQVRNLGIFTTQKLSLESQPRCYPAAENFDKSILANCLDICRFSCDDEGNADVFTFYYGDIVRFNCDMKRFHIWNGKAWAADFIYGVERLAGDVMEKYRNSLQPYSDGGNKRLQAQYSHARSSCNISKVNSLVEVLKVTFAVRQSEFDTHSNLLNVKNGVVDLQTGMLFPHNPSYMFSRLIDTEYVPSINLASTVFYSFVNSICCGNPDLIQYLQTAFGYGITGETKEQVMFLLKGSGSNGKTTLVEAIGNTVGSLLSHLPIAVLIGANDPHGAGKANPELAAVTSSRILIASEANDDDCLNEGKVKQLTGEGTITIRQLYCECFEIKPTFKIFLDTNHLPKIRGTDFAIWRRVRVIPFDRSFRGSEVDKMLPTKLAQKHEKECILFWLVQGALRYYHEGLREAYSVTSATESYRRNEDILGRFIDERIEMIPGTKCSASDLHSAYTVFCEEEGFTPANPTEFGRQLKSIGIEKKRTSAGVQYCDIGIKN